MSEETKPKRTTKEIQSDFNNLAFRAGHLQHDIFNKEKDLQRFNESLVTLQIEYNTAKQKEDAEAKAAADAAEAAKGASDVPVAS